MDIIDRSNEKKLFGAQVAFCRTTETQHAHIRFNIKAVKTMDLGKDKRVHFASVNGHWYVGLTDSKYGYKLTTLNNGTVRLCAKTISDVILSEYGSQSIAIHMKLEPTGTYLKGFPLFEIITRKTTTRTT